MVNNYDKYANIRHNDLINGKNPAHRFVEKPMMKSMIPNLKNKKILMLGCGSGEESELLKQNGAVDNNIIGIDLSNKEIELAKELYPNIKFIAGDMHNLPFKDNSFDFVYSSLTIHYSKEPEKVYQEVNRILKKDGMFLFSIAHPLRWSATEKEIDGEIFRIIGCSKEENSSNIYGKYNSFENHSFSSFSWNINLGELSIYVGPPSMHFKLLRNNNFDVLDFTESKCIEEIKNIDENYYIKNSEIPQFMAFLAKKR